MDVWLVNALRYPDFITRLSIGQGVLKEIVSIRPIAAIATGKSIVVNKQRLPMTRLAIKINTPDVSRYGRKIY